MATLYPSLGFTSQDINPDDSFFAGSFPRAENPCTILTGQTALPRGTLLMLSGTKHVAYDGVDPTDIVGVLGVATPAATADVPAFMYVTGEFNKDLLVIDDGTPANAADLAALETLNIYGRRVD